MIRTATKNNQIYNIVTCDVFRSVYESLQDMLDTTNIPNMPVPYKEFIRLGTHVKVAERMFTVQQPIWHTIYYHRK